MELGRNSSNEEILSRDVDNIRRNMYNARRKIISTLPKSCEDVLECVRNLELKTVKEENFVIDISDSEKIIIFSCFTNIFIELLTHVNLFIPDLIRVFIIAIQIFFNLRMFFYHFRTIFM